MSRIITEIQVASGEWQQEGRAARVRDWWERAQGLSRPKTAHRLLQTVEEEEPLQSAAALRKLSGADKVAGWQIFFRQLLTRWLITIYALPLLVVTERVTMNVLSRYMYLDQSGGQMPLAAEHQRALLQAPLPLEGRRALVAQLSATAETIVPQWPLAQRVTWTTVDQHLRQLLTRVPLPDPAWLVASLPDDADVTLTCLVQEIRDVLVSEPFSTTVAQCSEVALNFQLKSLEKEFTLLTSDSEEVPMPKLLPLLKRKYEDLLSETSSFDDYYSAIWRARELEDFSYYVFCCQYDET